MFFLVLFQVLKSVLSLRIAPGINTTSSTRNRLYVSSTTFPFCTPWAYSGHEFSGVCFYLFIRNLYINAVMSLNLLNYSLILLLVYYPTIRRAISLPASMTPMQSIQYVAAMSSTSTIQTAIFECIQPRTNHLISASSHWSQDCRTAQIAASAVHSKALLSTSDTVNDKGVLPCVALALSNGRSTMRSHHCGGSYGLIVGG